MKAWHFVGNKLRDGSPVPSDGEWLVHDGELVMCESGLHASKRLIDALKYAPGGTICRVEVGGKILHDDDKLVAKKRKILWRVDGEQVLRAFARWCALQVIHLWDAARDADWTASRAAAWAAAWDAAWDAGWGAARAASRDADWGAQNKQLEKMVREARDGKTEWVFDIPERN